MIESLELDRIFRAARERGFQHAEIYAETCHHASVDIHSVSVQGRIEDVRLSTTGGVALKCVETARPWVVRHFSTSQITTKAILALLGGEADRVTRKTEPTAVALDGTAEKMSVLSQTARAVLGMEEAGVRHPSFRYRDTVKLFEVVTSSGLMSQGREETAEASVQWALEKAGRLHHFSSECSSDSIDRMLGDLRRENPFHKKVTSSIGLMNPWPCPAGEIPILWSPRAAAKLFLQFLRGFEGDLVLNQRSFLTRLELPLHFNFAVSDAPDTSRLAFDHEGSPRRALTLFEGGRPRALAVNNALAEALHVTSTGHCRRQSLHAAPTVAFWNPIVRAARAVSDPLSRMGWGIHARDIDVIRFDPLTASVRLKLSEATIVHHGEEGEWIEPTELDLNLLDLLSRVVAFDAKFQAVGLAREKRGQRFVTEISTPAALAEPLPVPGQVPLNHYW